MNKRIPIVLETDRKSYDLAVDNMISEGGPVVSIENKEDTEDKEKPLH
ncbi:hypothetical protein [Alkalicoccus daliensis]|uniref:Uncharacterized protein n=1 Tax=Alkalicoccus daliensis TaxID=745820 RepID=A0A1G9ZMI5_9BACI|nr:hypothetical protein [Alkalicoccus daliensis]SDN22548.1 hypothetical protein SAMN04488053_101169 [Alkalicoccus daliensis]